MRSFLHRLLPMVFDEPEKDASPILEEQDLTKLSKYDKYKHEVRTRDFFLWIVEVAVIFVCGVLGYEIVRDYAVRKTLVDLLLQNIVGITYSSLAVAGITIASKK